MKRTMLALSLLILAGCAGTAKKGNLTEAARVNTQLGVSYLRDGEVQMAQEKLERALSQDDGYAPAHSALAVVLQREGDLDGADKHFRRALKLDPSNPDTLNNFGQFQCARGHNEEADRYFMQAANDKSYGTPEAAWTNAGVCAKGYDRAKAEADFREALRINPQFTGALAQMALLNYANQDYLHARAFLQRYEVAGKTTPETLVLGAHIERALGDEIAARKYEVRLRRDFPDSAEAQALNN